MVTDVTALQDESSQSEKISSPDIAQSVNNKLQSQAVIDVTPVTAPVTPAFELETKPCNNSKTCNNSIAPQLPFTPGDQVKVSAQYPGAEEYKGERATVVEVWRDGRQCLLVELDREVIILGKSKKQLYLDGRYLVLESVADSNLNENELELVERALKAIADKNPAAANDVYCQVHELGVKEAVKAVLTNDENEDFRRLVKVWKKSKSQP